MIFLNHMANVIHNKRSFMKVVKSLSRTLKEKKPKWAKDTNRCSSEEIKGLNMKKKVGQPH